MGRDPEVCLRDLGFKPGQHLGVVDADTAMALDLSGLAVGTTAEWTVVVDPLFFVDPVGSDAPRETVVPATLQRRLSSMQIEALALLLEGTSGTYGFAYFKDGKEVRAWLQQEGQTIFERGRRLAAESVSRLASVDSEEALLSMASHVGAPADALAELEFQLYSRDFNFDEHDR